MSNDESSRNPLDEPPSDDAHSPETNEPFDSDATEPLTIRLDQFLKVAGITETGGQAKLLIQSGEVRVNGEQETRRRRKLHLGDVVQFEDFEVVVESDG